MVHGRFVGGGPISAGMAGGVCVGLSSLGLTLQLSTTFDAKENSPTLSETSFVKSVSADVEQTSAQYEARE